ncbi:MOSC domain-containing protein [Streptomyces termitum]|uniref:Molybdenum cofactor biosysynthesis protein n=1 Tax=Streptomyces termitum TaxID=67368 RepID=A0A918T234_9ACTN|nr:MOSC N-terminal beta barrel domain-containing protein [Streptomyces termitum]GHA85981.1 molybdenum cofactor biosysynthesis protein [Streptomyces termitum]
MADPVLRSVHVHPVKALRALAQTEAEVRPWGLTHDRRWAVVDARGTVMTQRRHPRLALATAEPLPGGGLRLSAPGRAPLVVEVPAPAATLTVDIFDQAVETVPAGEAAAAWFSAFLEDDARLVHLDAPEHRRPVDPAYALPGETVSLADGYPLLVTSTASLDALNALIADGDHAHEGPLPMNRFRPNFVVDGTAPWAEDGWTRLAVGEVTFRVAKPCGRCVVTTTDQATAARGKEPLRTLGRHRRIGGKLVFGQNLVPEGTGTVRVGDPVKILD